MHISFLLCFIFFIFLLGVKAITFFYLFQVVKLYERCLIACANYPEYWIRYVLCMETSGSMELANNALARATQVFVKVCSLMPFIVGMTA